jgi:hypothetical protein
MVGKPEVNWVGTEERRPRTENMNEKEMRTRLTMLPPLPPIPATRRHAPRSTNSRRSGLDTHNQRAAMFAVSSLEWEECIER